MIEIKNPSIYNLDNGESYATGTFTMSSGTYQTFTVDCGFEPDFFYLIADNLASGYCGAMASKFIFGGQVLSYDGTQVKYNGNTDRITTTPNGISVARAATFPTGTYSWRAYKAGAVSTDIRIITIDSTQTITLNNQKKLYDYIEALTNNATKWSCVNYGDWAANKEVEMIKTPTITMFRRWAADGSDGYAYKYSSANEGWGTVLSVGDKLHISWEN